ncbi:acyl-CoA dehydrogenase FadE [Paraferrimonas sp. SM1919]|uniref:acyl-CoA dehydrogenase FadE n=1 Tax=Paraferrimonas sp. SM1919 TaxID=2662263 RepID=UPI0013D144F6|nr:acyl-CoA dehydrogenase FadE [Paraferrimonas sp. SM1919]
MEVLISTLCIVAVIGLLAYIRVSLAVSSVVIIATAGALVVAEQLSPMAVAVITLLLALINIKSLRRALLSKPMFKVFKKITPEMSSTEKDAINAGTTWWDAELFSGKPDWQQLQDVKINRLTAEEQAFLDGPVEEVAKMINDFEISHELADLPQEVWQYLKDNKFFAMIIKKKYGGLEFSAYAQSRVLQKLSGLGSVLSSTVGVPNSLGPGELLQHYGTKEQQDYYLPRLANGQEIPCFALTSPEAGSDAGAIPDDGVVCKGMWQGQEIVGIRLNWNKRYITLAPVATVLGLAFKMKDPDGLLGDVKDIGITCALVPTDMEGIQIGRRHFPLNTMFQNGPTQGKDVFVPLDYIIGGAKMAGQGWRMLVECLSVGRAITLPSTSAGGLKTISLATGAYARIRRQFKLPIGKLEGIEEPLARIGGNAYLADAVTKMTTTAIDLGEKPSVLSAICKYHLTDRMQKSLVDAMDIHGGKGVCLGPNNYLGRAYQGAPIAVTVEGANILTRSMIIYGQGAIRCHPFVLKELQAAFNEDSAQGLKEFDEAVFGHIGFTISNFFRSVGLALSGSRLTSVPSKAKNQKYYRTMTRFSANLALLSDLLMGILGGQLKRKERLSARMGDVLSQLYLSSATLKRFESEGMVEADRPLMDWAVQDSLYKAQEALYDLLENFPIGFMGKVLKVLLFPFGKTVSKPSDKLDHKVAKILQTPCETRTRLGEGQPWAVNDNNPVAIQEQTLVQMLKVEPIYDKVCQGLGEKLPFMFLDHIAKLGLEKGVITQEEAQELVKAEKGRLLSINVDDFDPQVLSNIKTANVENHQAA